MVVVAVIGGQQHLVHVHTHTRLQESGGKRVERARYVGFVSTKAKNPVSYKSHFLGADVDVEEEGRHAEVASAHRETTRHHHINRSVCVCTYRKIFS